MISTGNRRRIAIITDDPGWHGVQLRAAFERQGYASDFASLRACSFDVDATPFVVQVPGFEGGLPDGVFVRGVPGGTLEEIVFYLDVLHILSRLGVHVYNDGRAIERTVDKCMTSVLLSHAGIPTPSTWVHADREQARARVRREAERGRELVVKPLFGSQGAGLMRVSREDELPDPDHCRGVYYLQRFVERGSDQWHDWRVFVVGGRAVAAMRRESTHWISNVARGAVCHPVMLDDSLRQLGEAATETLDLAYAGVDILADRAGERWVVEVNSVPAWKGLQQVSTLCLADILAADFVSRIDNAQS